MVMYKIKTKGGKGIKKLAKNKKPKMGLKKKKSINKGSS
jgi:hypothetical protein